MKPEQQTIVKPNLKIIRAPAASPLAQAIGVFLLHYETRSLSRGMLRYYEELLPGSPTRKVRMPKLPKDILPAFDSADVKAILKACNNLRDSVIVYFLLNTGCRAAEFVALNVGDVDQRSGTVTVRGGKGAKDGVTFLGVKSRRILAKYVLPGLMRNQTSRCG